MLLFWTITGVILATADKLTTKARHFFGWHFDRVFHTVQSSFCFKGTAHGDLTELKTGKF